MSDECPHCSPSHELPESRPWGVFVGNERDGDGQPTHLRAAPSNGAHVAQSDADWLWQLIRNYEPEVSGVSGYIPDWRDEEENEPRVNGTFPECTCLSGNGSPALYEGPVPWCDAHGQPSVAYDRGFEAGKIDGAQALKWLDKAGFEADSVASAVESGDLSLLKHPGRYAVKLESANAEFNGVTPENRERAARYIYRSRAPIGEPRDEWERMKDGSTRKKTYLRAADEIVKLYMGWDQ